MTKKSLPNFTKSDKRKVTMLLKKEITNEDVEKLNPTAKTLLYSTLGKSINRLKGEELDNFLKNVDQIMHQNTRNQVWQQNHAKIQIAILNHIGSHLYMPDTNTIVSKTGLSRQTIHKHLKGFHRDEMYQEQMQQFKMISNSVLSRMASLAINGNIPAAKVFLNAIGRNGNNSTSNNYIQINNTILNQQTVESLNAEQLKEIEAIVKNLLRAK